MYDSFIFKWTLLFYFRLQCRFVASNSQLQYSDIVDGKPVTLSMAIDSIESLQRQLNDVERKVSTLLFSKKQSRIQGLVFIGKFAGDWVGVLSNCTVGFFWGASATLIGYCEKYYQKQSHRAIQYNKADPVLHVTSNWPIETAVQLASFPRGGKKRIRGSWMVRNVVNWPSLKRFQNWRPS